MTGHRGRKDHSHEGAMRGRILEKLAELARREGSAALPAAIRAASHAGKEFLKKFPEEFAKERRKR